MPAIPLPESKRLVERCGADPSYLERLRATPREAAAEYGFDWDPEEVRFLWDPVYRQARPDRPPQPAVLAYSDYARGKLALREEMRSTASHHPAYQRWRERQKCRLRLELGEARSDSIVHAPACFELNRGCSVGCWFCGISAPKLTDIWPYSPENATLWREALGCLGDLLGPLARWGFCYWATDPLDNPDYEKFCLDYHEVLGMFPQTTTALALRDPARVRSLLQLSQDRGCQLNRFSILTLPQYLRVHREFSPQELLHVECVPQNQESSLQLTRAGKAREKIADAAGTIACVSGFLFNMVERSVKLITPCASSPRWPLGYQVLAEAGFQDAADLSDRLAQMLDRLPLSVGDLPCLGWARCLEYRETPWGLELASEHSKLKLRDPSPAWLHTLGRRLQEGRHSLKDLALLGQPIVELLERLFEQGALNEGYSIDTIKMDLEAHF